MSKKKSKVLEWKDFPQDTYEAVASQMVHFSAKPTNTNTLAFGIRLESDGVLNVPYLAVQTISGRLPYDIVKNSSTPYKLATVSKQINAVLNGNCDAYGLPPSNDEKQKIFACTSILNSRYEGPTKIVGIRLRQMILQDASGKDISITPLSSPGMGVLINERLKQERNISDQNNSFQYHYRKRAFLNLGGNNPINLGINSLSMRSVLIFEGPSLSSASMKKALSIYYKGISLTPNSKILEKFILWQEKMFEKKINKNFKNLRERNKERKYLVDITKNILKRSDKARQLLLKQIKNLPESELCSSELSNVQRGLIDDSLRDSQWKKDFANELHSKIIGAKVYMPTKEHKSLNTTKHESLYWIDIIKGVI